MDVVLETTVGGYWVLMGAYVVIHVQQAECNI
jgi:hypothetical protein